MAKKAAAKQPEQKPTKKAAHRQRAGNIAKKGDAASSKSTRTAAPKHDRDPSPAPELNPVRFAAAAETVVSEPPRCPRPSCRSTAITSRGPADITAVNTTVRGLPVTHVVRTPSQCATCQQLFNHVQHVNYPSK